jgi:hypothetical protein
VKILKKCKICNREYQATTEYFYKNKSSKDGLHPWCKECAINKQRNIYWSDPILGREKKKEWRDNNKESHRNMIKEWEKKNEEHLKESRTAWRRGNPDKVREYNKERNMNKQHDITDQEWFGCLDYFNNSCAYCELSEQEQFDLYNEQFHKEHVIHNGNNYIDNCVPSCTSCNTSKHDAELSEWYCEKNYNFTKERLNKITKWMTEDCFEVLNLI